MLNRSYFQLCPGITIDFDLSDPFFTDYKPGEYRPLHDPHLKHFLNKKSVRRCLTKNNLITKDGEVRCTLQEYNRFQVGTRLGSYYHRITFSHNLAESSIARLLFAYLYLRYL